MTITGQDFIKSCDELRRAISGRKVQKPVSMMPLDLPDLPDSWCWTSLSILCERVSVGHVGPTSEFFCDVPQGIPFIRSQDVRPGKLTMANVAHVVEEFHQKLKKSQLKSGDILIVRVGANRGDCCVVPVGVGSLNCANIVFARPMQPNNFLGYYFNSNLGQSLLSSLTTGSAQGVLNTQSIAAIPVPVPPVNLQHKIASILSAYDDLIENNTRRIAILEEMAQAIYREWFVNFRFPGHENVKLVDSPLGQIPEGWEVAPLGQLTNADRKITYGVVKPGDHDPIGVRFVRGGDILGGQVDVNALRTITSEVSSQYKRTLLQGGELLVSLVGNPGEVAIAPKSLAGANIARQVGLVVIDDPLTTTYVKNYMMSSHGKNELFAHTTGSVQKVINLANLKVLRVIRPPSSILNQTIPIFEDNQAQVQTLRNKNQNLRTTRDLLLPKLISGKLDVEDLDIDLGESIEELEEVTA